MNPHLTTNQTRLPGAARRAFTLIELLTVISIIAVLAALLIPTLAAISRQKYISAAKGELGQVQAAIDSYKAKYGSYPPSNPGSAQTNQLYYELSGTTHAGNTFTTLDGQQSVDAGTLTTVFGAAGIVNCTHGSGEDAVPAKNFLLGLKPGQAGNLPLASGGAVTLLISSVRGLDAKYQPVGQADTIPFCYNSFNPTNNPGSYDLWIDLSIAHKTNRISNWSRQVQILP